MRATGELATSTVLLSMVRLLPPGDGHPVLVVPGFLGSDGSTWVLRSTLERRGYQVHRWDLGRNLGPTAMIVKFLPERLERIYREAGRRVSIVGQSLGGVYARALARMLPDHVRQVVTLGTPVTLDVEDASTVGGLYDRLRAFHVPGITLFDEGAPLDVPATALHTASDGVVHWETCLIRAAPNAENIRMSGSHIGMAVNPAGVFVVAERLAQPEGAWEPFCAPKTARAVLSVVEPAEAPTE